MCSDLTAHEAMTEEMDRIRTENDFLKKHVHVDVLEQLTAEKRKCKTLEERLVILTGKLAQAMQGIPSSDYSN